MRPLAVRLLAAAVALGAAGCGGDGRAPLVVYSPHGRDLLQLKRPAEALAAFETTLQREPNRFRAIYGAARAADATGDRQKARVFYEHLVQITKGADLPGRRELVEARKMAR